MEFFELTRGSRKGAKYKIISDRVAVIIIYLDKNRKLKIMQINIIIGEIEAKRVIKRH